jgi:hypothetical protein
MKHSNSELVESLVDSMEEAIENYERKLTAIREIKRIAGSLSWAEEFNLYRRPSVRRGLGVYYIYHKDELVYIGMGNVGDRICKFRDALTGKNVDHQAGTKARDEDSEPSNYSATYVILGNSDEFDGAAAALEYNLIDLNKIRGLAKYNDKKMAGK